MGDSKEGIILNLVFDFIKVNNVAIKLLMNGVVSKMVKSEGEFALELIWKVFMEA